MKRKSMFKQFKNRKEMQLNSDINPKSNEENKKF